MNGRPVSPNSGNSRSSSKGRSSAPPPASQKPKKKKGRRASETVRREAFVELVQQDGLALGTADGKEFAHDEEIVRLALEQNG